MQLSKCYLERNNILKVLCAKIMALLAAHNSFFTQLSQTKCHLSASFGMPCNFSSLPLRLGLSPPESRKADLDFTCGRFVPRYIQLSYVEIFALFFPVDFHVGRFLSRVPQHCKLCSYRKGKRIMTEIGQTLFIIS